MKWGNAGSREAVRLAAALLRGRGRRKRDSQFARGMAAYPCGSSNRADAGHPQNCERGQKCLGDQRKAFRSPGLWKMLARERTTTGAVGGQRLHNLSWKFGKRGRAAAHKDRRKPGVAWRSAASDRKNSSRILLTENGRGKILRVRHQLPSQRTFQRSFPDPHAGKTVSKEYRCLHNWKK